MWVCELHKIVINAWLQRYCMLWQSEAWWYPLWKWSGVNDSPETVADQPPSFDTVLKYIQMREHFNHGWCWYYHLNCVCTCVPEKRRLPRNTRLDLLLYFRNNFPFIMSLKYYNILHLHTDLTMLQNCFSDFAVEYQFDCCATESSFAGDIGAIEIWLIDWLAVTAKCFIFPYSPFYVSFFASLSLSTSVN